MTVAPLRRRHPSPGLVSLVGAGPGDPELLTVRGLRRLRQADVVLFDRLVGAALLDETRPGCELLAVGKTPGGESTRQEEIHRLLVERSRRGLRVVRLKGGDPFVFGRGFEEVEALRAEGLPVEVVPGISSALAGPAAAGIPVTERGRAASFAVVTGHRAPGLADGDEDVDWSALSRVDTLVVLMGVGRLREICARLISLGKDPATPAAVVEDATLESQREVRAPLSRLARAATASGIRAPAVLVVGPTVRPGDQAFGRWTPTAASSFDPESQRATTGEVR
ncbi:MAG TPA: uroporphyrinogen-III C-methyltransferase [Thermoanaerobaculia bacterium]|nr:uroporphyrinogen-III C-methyltransferase [Thermoanaerobaculia bacterium]